MSDLLDRISEVVILSTKPGDAVLVKLGLEFEDGPPWIPADDDIDYYRNQFEQIVPEGVVVLVTHFGLDVEVLRKEEENE